MKKTIVLLLFIVLFASFSEGKRKRVKDVCILGGGASGMGAAVFLKDRGYDVLVLDQEPQIGGNCHTFFFNPPTVNDTNWIELGSRFFFDTEKLEALNLGHFRFKTAKFLERFVDPSKLIDVSMGIPNNFGADFELKLNISNLPLPATQTGEQVTGLIRLLIFLGKYPFLETGIYPDVIPPELTVPFSDFIAAHGFEPLISTFFKTILLSNEVKQFSEIPTIVALKHLQRFMFAFVAGEQVAMIIEGGCQTLYQGISQYIGARNIKNNVFITKLQRVRKHGGKEGKRDHIEIEYTSRFYEKEAHCRNIIIDRVPSLSNLQFLDLTRREKEVFSHISLVHLYFFAADIVGGVANLPFDNVFNLNSTSPDLLLPAVFSLTRDVPYGPAMGIVLSPYAINDFDLKNLIQTQLSGIPLFDSASLIPGTIHHHAIPEFDLSAFVNNVNPYQLLSALQGRLNTFWVGSLFPFDQFHAKLDHTLRLIESHFPKKN